MQHNRIPTNASLISRNDFSLLAEIMEEKALQSSKAGESTTSQIQQCILARESQMFSALSDAYRNI